MDTLPLLPCVKIQIRIVHSNNSCISLTLHGAFLSHNPLCISEPDPYPTVFPLRWIALHPVLIQKDAQFIENRKFIVTKCDFDHTRSPPLFRQKNIVSWYHGTRGMAIPLDGILITSIQDSVFLLLRAAAVASLPASLHDILDSRGNFWNGCGPVCTRNVPSHTATTREYCWCGPRCQG